MKIDGLRNNRGKTGDHPGNNSRDSGLDYHHFSNRFPGVFFFCIQDRGPVVGGRRLRRPHAEGPQPLFRILPKKTRYRRRSGSGLFLEEFGRYRIHCFACAARSPPPWYFATSFLYLGASYFSKMKLKYALSERSSSLLRAARYPGFCVSVFSLFFLGPLYLFKKMASSSPGPVPKKKGRAGPGRPEARLSVLRWNLLALRLPCLYWRRPCRRSFPRGRRNPNRKLPTSSPRNLMWENGASGGPYSGGELRAQREGPGFREGTRTAATDVESIALVDAM